MKTPALRTIALRLTLFFAGAGSVAAATVPNFVFILADDQAWSGTAVPMIPGNAATRSPGFPTPNLERLATQGMTFSQAYAAHCKCEASRAAIQMGRTTTSLNAPDRTARNWKAPVTDSLANTLKRANPHYRAAHFGKWQWFHSPASMGYDASDGITTNRDGESPDPNDPKLSFSLTRRAGAFMATQAAEGRPFYLQISYYAVHPEAQSLPATLAKYAGLSGGGGKSKGGGRNERAPLAAMTEDLDTCVGAILKTLDDLGLGENTYVIYMSDNGGRAELLNGGKGNLGEGGLRVPLIVRGPGIRGGVYANEPVVGYDIFATVLDLAAPSAALPRGLEGGSWKEVLSNGGVGQVRRPIDRFVFHQAVEVPHPQSAIRQGDFKLIYTWDTREAQLFNVAQDLGESRNLAKEKPELAARLQTELKEHVRAGLGDQACDALESGGTATSAQVKKKKQPKR